jgi:hypothetical protein
MPKTYHLLIIYGGIYESYSLTETGGRFDTYDELLHYAHAYLHPYPSRDIHFAQLFPEAVQQELPEDHRRFFAIVIRDGMPSVRQIRQEELQAGHDLGLDSDDEDDQEEEDVDADDYDDDE